MRAIIFGITASILFASPTFAASTMSGKELTALLSQDKQLILGGPKEGYQGELNISKEGTAKGQVKLDSGDVIAIEGVWHIAGNKFCRTWKGGRDAGKEVCETWVKTGPTSVQVKNGKKDLGVNSWK
ncbi:hypothetical protein [Nostoc sp. DedVER01b]|uniref:hypothetical protein n=1 Tax=Nostoc sp. DedVER01b TaxID=3075404 RepID=UPI002AD4CDB7|nr:hypothetical protein [Nostoc sp. DedVER01b]MDZ8110745.1 hypothetical protein [Nostoc sp. DedVER01b]